jgi:hypothetical protein
VIDVDSDLERMQDYVGGRLSEEEHRAFEERLLRDPALVREFEQSLRLRDGLEQLRAQGYFDEHAPRPKALRAWLPALAAAAAVAVVALLVWVQRAPPPVAVLQASLAGNGLTAPIAHFTFVAMRSGTAPELQLPPSGVVEFRAAPPLHDADAHYRMSLLRQSDVAGAKTLGSLERLTQGADGYVHGFADAAHLAPGLYTLRVEADAPRGSAATFPFSFRARRTL